MKPNTEQQTAIDSTAKEIVLIAGPGSGKTTTIVNRVVRMINQGVAPEEIAIITYTNAGADHVAEKVKEKTDGVTLGFVGTLHAFCLKIIDAHQSKLGNAAGIAVIDEETSDDMLKAVADSLKVNKPLKALKKARGSNNNRTPEGLVSIVYQRTLAAINATDFDLILQQALDILLGNKSPERIGEIRHLFVDEVQDSSAVDLHIYQAIPVETRFMVGDPDQGIYGFRGGVNQNVIAAATRVGTANLYLETNYRSGTKICGMADAMINHNRKRLDKKMRPANEFTGAAMLLESATDTDEATAIRDGILNLIKQGTPPTEIAVLTRYNRHADGISQICRASGIPVRKKAEVSESMRDAIRFAGMMTGNATTKAIATSRFKGPDRCAKLVKMVVEGTKPAEPDTPPPPKDPVEFYSNLTTLGCDPREARQLCRWSRTGGRFSVRRAILSAERALVEGAEQGGDGVYFGSIHSAKGREWDHVIIAAYEEEVIPGKKTGNDLEEERRLAYVGTTRPRKTITYSWAYKRKGFGSGIDSHVPCRFINETGLATSVAG